MFSATSALDTCPVLLWFHKWKSHNCVGFFTRMAVSHHTPKGETVIQSFSMIPIIFTVKKHNWFNRLMDKTFSFLRADSMKSKIIHGVHYFPMLTICCYHPEAFGWEFSFQLTVTLQGFHPNVIPALDSLSNHTYDTINGHCLLTTVWIACTYGH